MKEWNAMEKQSEEEKGSAVRDSDTVRKNLEKYCTITCAIAGVSILVEIGFMIAAVILWNSTMNPWHWTSYGDNGSSFFFCSLYSSICNVFVIVHFWSMRQGPSQQAKQAKHDAVDSENGAGKVPTDAPHSNAV